MSYYICDSSHFVSKPCPANNREANADADANANVDANADANAETNNVD